MPKRVKHKKRLTDVNQLAHRLVELSTAEPDLAPAPANISEYMAAIGRKGGRIGGKRRLTTMTAAQRKKGRKQSRESTMGKTWLDVAMRRNAQPLRPQKKAIH
jgi:hypothetical protein